MLRAFLRPSPLDLFSYWQITLTILLWISFCPLVTAQSYQWTHAESGETFLQRHPKVDATGFTNFVGSLQNYSVSFQRQFLDALDREDDDDLNDIFSAVQKYSYEDKREVFGLMKRYPDQEAMFRSDDLPLFLKHYPHLKAVFANFPAAHPKNYPPVVDPRLTEEAIAAIDEFVAEHDDPIRLERRRTLYYWATPERALNAEFVAYALVNHELSTRPEILRGSDSKLHAVLPGERGVSGEVDLIIRRMITYYRFHYTEHFRFKGDIFNEEKSFRRLSPLDLRLACIQFSRNKVDEAWQWLRESSGILSQLPILEADLHRRVEERIGFGDSPIFFEELSLETVLPGLMEMAALLIGSRLVAAVKAAGNYDDEEALSRQVEEVRRRINTVFQEHARNRNSTLALSLTGELEELYFATLEFFMTTKRLGKVPNARQLPSLSETAGNMFVFQTLSDFAQQMVDPEIGEAESTDTTWWESLQRSHPDLYGLAEVVMLEDRWRRLAINLVDAANAEAQRFERLDAILAGEVAEEDLEEAISVALGERGVRQLVGSQHAAFRRFVDQDQGREKDLAEWVNVGSSWYRTPASLNFNRYNLRWPDDGDMSRLYDEETTLENPDPVAATEYFARFVNLLDDLASSPLRYRGEPTFEWNNYRQNDAYQPLVDFPSRSLPMFEPVTIPLLPTVAYENIYYIIETDDGYSVNFGTPAILRDFAKDYEPVVDAHNESIVSGPLGQNYRKVDLLYEDAWTRLRQMEEDDPESPELENRRQQVNELFEQWREISERDIDPHQFEDEPALFWYALIHHTDIEGLPDWNEKKEQLILEQMFQSPEVNILLDFVDRMNRLIPLYYLDLNVDGWPDLQGDIRRLGVIIKAVALDR